MTTHKEARGALECMQEPKRFASLHSHSGAS